MLVPRLIGAITRFQVYSGVPRIALPTNAVFPTLQALSDGP